MRCQSAAMLSSASSRPQERVRPTRPRSGRARRHQLAHPADEVAREVTISGGVVGLTRIEFDLLDALTATPRVVVSRTALLEGIWGANWYGDDHVMDFHLSNLRRKIGAGYVRTVRGVGYRTGDGT